MISPQLVSDQSWLKVSTSYTVSAEPAAPLLMLTQRRSSAHWRQGKAGRPAASHGLAEPWSVGRAPPPPPQPKPTLAHNPHTPCPSPQLVSCPRAGLLGPNPDPTPQQQQQLVAAAAAALRLSSICCCWNLVQGWPPGQSPTRWAPCHRCSTRWGATSLASGVVERMPDPEWGTC